jgi:hypothetical protein
MVLIETSYWQVSSDMQIHFTFSQAIPLDPWKYWATLKSQISYVSQENSFVQILWQKYYEYSLFLSWKFYVDK